MNADRIKLVNRKLFLCLILASIFYIIGITNVVQIGVYSKKQLVAFLVTFSGLFLSFIIGNFLKGLMPAVLMGTSFVITTLSAAFLYNSGILLLYLLVILAIITIYQNKFLMCYIFVLTFFGSLFGCLYGVKNLGWDNREVGLAPFIVVVTVLSVFLSYKQISHDNKIQKDIIMEKQKSAEEAYANLVSLSHVVSDSISQLVSVARDNRDETQTVLDSISSIVEALSEQSSSINMQVDNSKIIQGKLDDVMKYIDIMSGQAGEVISLAKKGESSMVTLNKNTEHVNQIAEKSRHGVEQLLSHVVSVQGVVEIITEVAEQTRLLSLNANIEAAKAGAYGSGFTVVAEEIRKLSDSTSYSVQQINDLLMTLQERTATVENEINEMNTAFGAQKKEIELTNGNMKELVVAMNSMRNGLDSVVYSTKEVVKSNEAVSGGVVNIARIAEEIEATLDNVSDACRRVFDSSNDTLNIAEEVDNKAKQLV